MKRQSLAIISIIAVGSLFGVAYSVGTVITDTGINTPSVTTGTLSTNALTVTGSCTGCGASEGNYNTWGIIVNNTSVITGVDVVDSIINNNGTGIIYDANGTTTILDSTGNIINTYTSTGSQTHIQHYFSQSVNGVYQPIWDITNDKIHVYKNNSIKFDISVNHTIFGNYVQSVSISPNGKYISIVGIGTGANLRYIVLQGS